ncbi:GGDEF domain-containing protein [Blastomonas sp.]|uniref:GGDEF domain-containing protein n=1 Tax=Blastomonas sp. TaxID=1909299 RepID=UPI0039188EAA
MTHDSDDQTVLELIARYSSDVIAQVRPDMTVSYISPSAERLFGLPTSQIIGRHVADFVAPEDFALITQATREVIAGRTDDTVVTVRVIRADGAEMWVEIASRLMGQRIDGDPGNRAVVIRDVSDRKALEDALRAMAMKDGLTGLANRRAFDEALRETWQATLRAGSQMSLLLVDIDDFKAFNDAYGHQVGDDCLRSVALAVQSAVHYPGDVVARYGGEELGIILPEADTRAAAIVCERVRKATVNLQILHGGLDAQPVSVSIGSATAMARDGGSVTMPEALLSAADNALYAAKAAGRNCCRSAVLLAKT